MFKKYNKLILAMILGVIGNAYIGLIWADKELLKTISWTHTTSVVMDTSSNASTIPQATTDSENTLQQLPAGMIMDLKGTASALKSNKKIHQLKDNSLIFNHDIILTKKDTNVAIRFNDGSLIVLGPNSALEIKEYQFTVPSKGQPYLGALNDRAVIKLFQGILKAKLGSLVLVNKPASFSILSPRGRVQITDPLKSPNIDLIYNNKIGLAVKAVGVLNNSKGQVNLTDKLYGSVSAVIGSYPAATSILPLIFSDAEVMRTQAFFDLEEARIKTTYNEHIMTKEEHAMLTELSDSSEDINASHDELAVGEEPGDDDGHVSDDE